MVGNRLAIMSATFGLVAIGLLVLGCRTPRAESPPVSAGDEEQVTLLGFAAGTTSQLWMDAVSEAVRRENPAWTVTSKAAGGEARLIASRLAGEADFFITLGLRRLEVLVQGPLHPDIDYERASEYRLVIPAFLMPVHFLARTDTSIMSPGDIVARRYPFRMGSGAGVARQLLSLVLQHYGASLDDAASWGASYETLLMNSAEGVEALQSGRVDMGFTYAGIPNSVLAGVKSGVRLLPLDNPGLASALAEWGCLPASIPAGTYSYVTQDLVTVAPLQSLATRADMPDDVVYGLLKSIFEHRDLILAAHGGAAHLWTPEFLSTAVSLGERNGEPYHPGALKYYREMGWLD